MHGVTMKSIDVVYNFTKRVPENKPYCKIN